jgi:hypothetical protein
VLVNYFEFMSTARSFLIIAGRMDAAALLCVYNGKHVDRGLKRASGEKKKQAVSLLSQSTKRRVA